MCVIGGSKKPEEAKPLLKYINNLVTDLPKIVILSPSTNKIYMNKIVDKYKRVKFKINVQSMSDYLNSSSVVITTYGSTTFKSMACKIPTFSVAFQEFQNFYATELEKTGLCINLGMFNNLNMNKLQLLTNDNFKVKMHKKTQNKFCKSGYNECIANNC